MHPRLKRLPLSNTMPPARFPDEQSDKEAEFRLSRHFNAEKLHTLCTKIDTYCTLGRPESQAIAIAFRITEDELDLVLEDYYFKSHFRKFVRSCEFEVFDD